MKQTTLSLLFLLLTTIAVKAQFTFTNYTDHTELAPQRVRSLLEGNDGLMWLATYNGLYSFDGYQFYNFKARPGDGNAMESNRLESICESGGGIWMCGYNGNVSRFDLTTERITDIPTSRLTAIRVIPDASGCVWVVSSDRHLVRTIYNKVSGKIETLSFFGNGNIEINDVRTDKNNVTLILTSRGLWTYSKGQMTRLGPSANYYGMMENAGRCVFYCGKGELVVWNGNKFTVHKLLTTADLTSGVQLSDGRMVIAAKGDGLYVLRQDLTIERFLKFIEDGSGVSLVKDSHDDVWFCTGQPGVMHFNSASGRLDHLDVPGIFSSVPLMWKGNVKIAEDKNGHTWVSPSGNGLALYDREHDVLLPFYDGTRQNGWTAENTVVDLMVDRMQNLWYCGKYTGLEKVTFKRQIVSELLKGQVGDAGVDVRGVFQDSKGRIWLGTRDGVISIYDRNFELIGYLAPDGGISKTIQRPFGHAYAFAEQPDGTIWIGTKYNGLFRLTSNGNNDFRLEHFTADGKPFSLPHNDIFSLYFDRYGRLWVATFGGGLCYARINGGNIKFVSAANGLKHYDIKRYDRARYVTGDGKGRIWVGTTSGMLSFPENFSNPQNIVFTSYRRNPNDASTLSYNDVFGILFTHDGSMYVSTNGGGFCRAINKPDGRLTFESYSVANGLRSDVVYSCQEDKAGNLWFATENGIAKFYPQNDRIETFSQRFFDERPDFSDGPSLRLSDGRIVFPTLNTAVVYFNPAKLHLNTFVPKIILSKLTVNQVVQQPSDDGILHSAVNSSESIDLPHGSNNVSIQFSALDYVDPDNISYAYKLDGFDRKWIYIGDRHEAVYSNLPPGKYTFMVRSTNSDGVWTNNVRKLDINVIPSFWQTGWAVALYIVLLLGFICLATYILYTIVRLKQKVSIERQISDMKMQFFTEISHEFRTPLTLISGCVKELLHKGVADKKTENALMVVNKNSNRLLHLVNEMLDIRKLLSGKTKLTLQQINLKQFIGSLLENFDNIALNRNIILTLECSDSSVVIWADPEKLDKIVFNLLSNAFRFTPRGKKITVSIMKHGEGARIIVADEGKGISPEHQKSIFELFSSNNAGSESHQPHTGVGLALTRDLVKLHNGKISVESEVGKGSRFVVDLPMNSPGKAANADYHVSDATVDDFSHEDVAIDDDPETIPAEEPADNDKPLLLVVEDNSEMRGFIHTILGDQYNVVEAADGRQGLETAIKNQPDLIVSDFMMPVMNGMEMAAQLRQDVRTSHIPIIILSARTDEESIVNGYNIGIDAYIEKPFSADVLRARIQNLIVSRKRLQKAYRKEYVDNVHDNKPLPGNDADKDFMERVTTLLNDNMQDDKLSVDRVASLLNMSRSVYFKKLKALTGLGPSDYLKSLRMRRSAELLRNSDKPVSDIAFCVGIPDSHYFSKCFRQYFNMTPSEYRTNPRPTNG